MSEYKETSNSYIQRAGTDGRDLLDLFSSYISKDKNNFLGRKYNLDQIEDKLARIVQNITYARHLFLQEKEEWKKESRDCTESSTESPQTEG